MSVEAIRIGQINEVEGELINLLSPLERKQLLVAAGQAKAAAMERNPGYIKPGLREDRYYAVSKDGSTLYWFASVHRRDDWVSWTGGTVVYPSLEETWNAIPYRRGDDLYYGRKGDMIYCFASIAKREAWVSGDGGAQYWPDNNENVQRIWKRNW